MTTPTTNADIPARMSLLCVVVALCLLYDISVFQLRLYQHRSTGLDAVGITYCVLPSRTGEDAGTSQESGGIVPHRFRT